LFAKLRRKDTDLYLCGKILPLYFLAVACGDAFEDRKLALVID
jgi:hypothetical protein